MQNIVLCLRGFAYLDHDPGEAVLAAIHQHVGAYAPQFDMQAMSGCLWALALLGLHALPSPTWNALITAFVGTLRPDQSLSGKQLHQLCTHQMSAAVFFTSTYIPRGSSSVFSKLALILPLSKGACQKMCPECCLLLSAVNP